MMKSMCFSEPGMLVTIYFVIFQISGENDDYRLYLDSSSYTGTIGDAMFQSHNPFQSVGKPFSTKDRDNDIWPSGSCAVDGVNRQGGWWFGWCSTSPLNKYPWEWLSLRGQYVEIKIRVI